MTAQESSQDLTLARRLEPVLWPTAGELFSPVPVEDYLADAAPLTRGAEGSRSEPRVIAEAGTLNPELLVELAQQHQDEVLSLRYVQEPMGRKEPKGFRSAGQLPAFRRSSDTASVGILARLIAVIVKLTLVVRGKAPGGQAARAHQQALAWAVFFTRLGVIRDRASTGSATGPADGTWSPRPSCSGAPDTCTRPPPTFSTRASSTPTCFPTCPR